MEGWNAHLEALSRYYAAGPPALILYLVSQGTQPRRRGTEELPAIMERRYVVKHPFTAAMVGDGGKARILKTGETLLWNPENHPSYPVVFKVDGIKFEATDRVQFTQSVERL
jgi:hypothetical protein